MKRPIGNASQDILVTDSTTALEPCGIVLDEEISPLAYAIWLERGRPDGNDREHWFEAEKQLRQPTLGVSAEQTREAAEARDAKNAGPANRDRMVAIGRGNQQAGRQGS